MKSKRALRILIKFYRLQSPTVVNISIVQALTQTNNSLSNTLRGIKNAQYLL